MRLFLSTTLTMLAFGGNSVLNRLALKGAMIDALDFAAIRLAAGAAVLVVLALVLRRRLEFGGVARLAGAAMLLVYMLGFSLAYLRLDAGTGALILFGGVQVTMFGGALWGGERIPPQRWAGAVLAFGGLVWLLWSPSVPPPVLASVPAAVPPSGGAAAGLFWPQMSMTVAAVGWGVYSLLGRRGGDALAGTAVNFALAAPLAVLLAWAVPAGGSGVAATLPGVLLALLSGGVTSGLGYALWYGILPQLGATRAGVAQLTVPLIALLGGMALLGEAPGVRFLGAALLVLGGVAVATLRGR